MFPTATVFYVMAFGQRKVAMLLFARSEILRDDVTCCSLDAEFSRGEGWNRC